MTLYHYVRNKDELIALMDDAMMGELLVPEEELPGGLARGADRRSRAARRDAFERHPLGRSSGSATARLARTACATSSSRWRRVAGARPRPRRSSR